MSIKNDQALIHQKILYVQNYLGVGSINQISDPVRQFQRNQSQTGTRHVNNTWK